MVVVVYSKNGGDGKFVVLPFFCLLPLSCLFSTLMFMHGGDCNGPFFILNHLILVGRCRDTAGTTIISTAFLRLYYLSLCLLHRRISPWFVEAASTPACSSASRIFSPHFSLHSSLTGLLDLSLLHSFTCMPYLTVLVWIWIWIWIWIWTLPRPPSLMKLQ